VATYCERDSIVRLSWLTHPLARILADFYHLLITEKPALRQHWHGSLTGVSPIFVSSQSSTLWHDRLLEFLHSSYAGTTAAGVNIAGLQAESQYQHDRR
jgi:hypothetical protein